MTFPEAKLYHHPLVEKAYETAHATATTGAKYDDAVGKIRKNMEEWYTGALHEYRTTIYDKDDLQKAEHDLKRDYEDYISRSGELATDILEDDFRVLNLRPAQLIQDAAENPSPVLIAAALLFPDIKNENDIEKISNDFGAETAGLIETLRHVTKDPEREAQNVAGESDALKTIYLARKTTLLQNDADNAMALLRKNPQEEIVLARTRAEQLFTLAEAAHGVNPQIDRHFRDAFNQMTRLAALPLDLSVNRVDELVLGTREDPVLKRVQEKPKEAPKEKTPTIIG